MGQFVALLAVVFLFSVFKNGTKSYGSFEYRALFSLQPSFAVL